MQLELPFLVDPPARADRRTRHVQLGGRVVPYRFRRARRRTIGIAVDEEGLQAAAPRWATIAEVEAFIREKQAWVLRKLEEARASRRPTLVWGEGVRIAYLGGEVAVFGAAPGEASRLAGTHLLLATPGAAHAACLREAALGWLRGAALALFRSRVASIAPEIGVEARRVSLSNARTQWGSCSADGRMRLSWRLIHVRPALIDYVVVHELAHLRHMNHSERFWRVVEAACPDYLTARRELRDLSHALPEL
ncbi:MAG: M48 family metallopeptidase [Burkholderiales bacterium]|nr:M48 family metallopeptidase [Burkholderiales bacterium]